MSEAEDSERSNSSSEEEDDDAKEVTEEIEKNFLRTLSCLRKKDPKIYDSNIKFFDDEHAGTSQEPTSEKKKKDKKKSLSVRQYETKLLLERGPDFIEEEEVAPDVREPSSPTYNEEQKALKENFKKILEASDSDDDSEELFKVKGKPVEVKEKEEKAFKKWLKGQKEDLDDKETKKDLQYLHDCWTDPNIDQGEEFLKDYILNKRYLDKDEESGNSALQEDLSEEEEEIKKADEFEHQYNFRFEEPDKEFLKRYPRDIESSMRRKKDKQEKRKLQREKAKERKQQKFSEKQKEVAELKKKKREELLQQIKKLKDLTGNEKLAFEDDIMDDEFDSSKFDKKMGEMFNDDFYNNEDLEKPVFEDDDFDYSCYENQEVDLEDPNFVMDCDYDPQDAKQKKLEKKLKSKEKKKKIKMISNDANDLPDEVKSNVEAFENYIDEFYKYDFEDLIDDIPCRFKYRKVVPNSYGLTIDEILAADDDELEKWCSIKKVDSIRSDHVEKNDAKIFAQKARDEALKRKILPSLYQYKDAEDFDTKPESEKPKKKKKKKKKQGAAAESVGGNSLNEDHSDKAKSKSGTLQEGDNHSILVDGNVETSDDADASEAQPKKKIKGGPSTKDSEETIVTSNINAEMLESDELNIKKKKKKKRKRSEVDGSELFGDSEPVETLYEPILLPKKKKKSCAVVEKTNDSPAASNQISENINLSGKKKKKHSISESNSLKTENASVSSSTQGKKKQDSLKKNKKQLFNNGRRNLDKPKVNHSKFNSAPNAKCNFSKNSFKAGNNKYGSGKFNNRNEFRPNTGVKSWQKSKFESNDKLGLSDARLQAYGINPKKYKNKLIYGSKND